MMEIWEFIKIRRKWWLAPVILSLLILGALIILAETSNLGPFIYTLF